MSSASPEIDSAIARELGMGGDDQGDSDSPEDQQDEGQVPDEVAFEDLPANWQDEIRRLRRENAAKRVVRRDSERRSPSSNGETAAPSQQAIQAAEARGRSSALMESGVRLAAAEVKASLADVMTKEQITDFIEGLDLGRFVEDDGSVDANAVQDWRERVGSLLATKKQPPRVGAGQRQGAGAQKSNADLFGDWLNGSGG